MCNDFASTLRKSQQGAVLLLGGPIYVGRVQRPEHAVGLSELDAEVPNHGLIQSAITYTRKQDV